MRPTPTLRPLTSHADYAACVALQRATWGDDFRELVPPAVLMVAEKTGGIAGGAFEADGSLVGFVFGLSGIENGRPIHWSHMLAVRADRRDHGIGAQLKHWQADRLCALGIRAVYWTFDPLVARNAHFNFNTLGVTAREYVRDMYGSGDQSTTDSVIGSDRFVVQWEIGGRAEVRKGGTVRSVAIPADIQALKQADPDGARRWRTETRTALEAAFAEGLTVTGFARTAEGGHYLLGPA